MPTKEIPYGKKKEELDGRVKLTERHKKMIRDLYKAGGTSTRKLAKQFNVSRRLIQFVIDPKKAKRCATLFAKRQADGRYYDKDIHRLYMQRHRLKKRIEGYTTAKKYKKTIEQMKKEYEEIEYKLQEQKNKKV